MATIVVGVGGGGRGVCNWLNRMREWEGIDDLFLYVIDGPIKDQYYLLPDNTQIDTSAGSQEFGGLSDKTDIVGALEGYVSGHHKIYKDWLDEEDAQKLLPVARAVDKEGLGMQRVAGRVQLFVDFTTIHDGIKDAVNRAIKKATQAGGTLDKAFIVGSQVGGTGSGMFLDIAIILKNKLPSSCYLYAVVLLPGVYGTVLGADRMAFSKAKAFTGMRELLKAQQNSIVIKYDALNEISIKPPLFDLLFAADGPAGPPPLYGGCAAAAELIYCVARGYLDNQLPNLRANYSSVIRDEKALCIYGTHSYLFMPKFFARRFAIRAAKEFFEKLVRDDDVKLNALRKASAEIESLLNSIKLLKHLRNKDVVLEPPVNPGSMAAFSMLKADFGHGIKGDPDITPDIVFPNILFKEIIENERKYLKFKQNNKQMVELLDNIRSRYIGSPASLDQRTLGGFLNQEKRAITSAFCKLLLEKIQSVFYDKGRPKSIEADPEMLLTVGYLLDEIKGELEAVQSKVKKALRDGSDPAKRKKDSALSMKGELLSKPSDKKKKPQDGFIDLYQNYLEVEIWEWLLKTSSKIAEDLIKLVKAFQKWFGDPAWGWITQLEKACDELEKKYAEKDNEFRNWRQNIAWGVFPQPAGEELLYREVSEPVLSNLRRGSAWEYMSRAPLDYNDWNGVAESLLLFFTCPDYIVGERPEMTKLFALMGNEAKSFWEIAFDASSYVQYMEKRFVTELEKYDIWDIFALDARGSGMTDDESENRIRELHAELIKKSAYTLRTTAVSGTMPGVLSQAFFIRPELGGGGSLAAAIGEVFNDPNAINALNKHKITRVDITVGIKARDWESWDDHEKNYFNYVESEGRLPIWLFKEDKAASVVETRLKRTISETLTPYFADDEALKVFSVAWIIKGEIFDFEWEKSKNYFKVYTKKDVCGKRSYLGKAYDLKEIIDNFMGDEDVVSGYRSFIDEIDPSKVEAKDATFEDYDTKMSTPGNSFKPAINMDDLKAVIKSYGEIWCEEKKASKILKETLR